MRVYILADLEGVSGVTQYDDWRKGDAGDQVMRARMADLMVGEVNAAVEGAVAAGATSVVVRDGHGYSDTIPIEKLDPRALLSQGRRVETPLPHLERDFAAVIMIGQHARAGSRRGCLSHTYSRRIRAILVNGVEMGEVGLNAAMAAEFGVPTRFVSGDTEVIQESRSQLGHIVTVETKESHSTLSALSRHPESVRRQISEGVTRALTEVGDTTTYAFGPPVELRVKYSSWRANVARFLLRKQWRWGRLAGARTVVYRGDSLNTLWQHFITGA